MQATSAWHVGIVLVALALGTRPSFAGQAAAPPAAAPSAATPGDAPEKPAKAATFVDLDVPLVEGDLKVTGRTDAAKVMVRVYSAWASADALGDKEETALRKQVDNDAVAKARLADLLKERSDLALAVVQGDRQKVQTITCRLDEPVSTAGPFAVTNAQFDATLKQRLNGGDCVVVEEYGGAASPQRQSAIVKSAIIDLGRLRGYFTIGGGTSQGRSQFSQVDTFAGFTADALVAGKVLDKSKEGHRQLSLLGFRRQLNGFVDSRVSFKVASTGTDTAKPAATTGGTPATPPFQRPDQLVFGANQPAFFQIGLHAPLSWKGMDWRHDGKLYSFFLGPIIKYGVESFAEPVLHTRTVTIDTTKPETDTARFKVIGEESRSGAAPFWGGGIRVGAYRYELLGQRLMNRQVANDLVAYLDATWGRAKGYRTYRFQRSKNAAGTIETVAIDSDLRPRFMLEGRLKLPSMPALVGIDMNVRGFDNDDEPNLFRFVLAFRVDAQKALAKIFKSDALEGTR